LDGEDVLHGAIGRWVMWSSPYVFPGSPPIAIVPTFQSLWGMSAQVERSMTMNQPIDAEKIGGAIAKSMHDHWALFLAEGIVLILLGALAIVVPPLATLAVTILFGWLLLISGVVGLITSLTARHAPGFWWSLLSGLIGISAGLVLCAWPLRGSVSLTLVLIIFFAIEGIASIMYAIEHRRQSSGHWGWMLASGLFDLILAGIIFAGLPGTAIWGLGLLLGINLMFGGFALIAMALHVTDIGR
jgi:uncharacterized membrane protein HdeD (DUF308 family)